MRDHGSSRTRSTVWRLLTGFALGGFDRHLRAIQAENKALSDRLDDLERTVARQGGQLRALMDLVPRMARHLTDADGGTPPERTRLH